MAKIERLGDLRKTLIKLSKKYGEITPSVTVGFTQNYALHVHENMEAAHTVGQAKFLEEPARTLKKEIANIVTKSVQEGATLEGGLLLAGLRLQREAQKLTPVDTSALKASAFTCLTENVEEVSSAAYEKAEAIRKRVLTKRDAAAAKKKAKK